MVVRSRRRRLRGRQALRRTVGRGPRTPLGKRLLPCENRPGEADQGLLDRPGAAVLRVRHEDRAGRHRRDTVRLAPVLIRPVAADDVASAVARTAIGAPLNGTVEVAGPEQFGSTSSSAAA